MPRMAAAIIGCWLGAVPEHVAQNVHAAALPGRAEDLADRVLEALMAV
jgi:hypothetical protein